MKTNDQPPTTKHKTIRFLLAILLQSVLILVVPAQAIYTRLSGQTVILQTRPVDPMDLLRGNYQVLDYEISRVENLQLLPGWPEILTLQRNGESILVEGTQFFVILQAPASPQRDLRPPQSWIPVEIRRSRPENLGRDRVALAGRYRDGALIYDLERYYMPEAQIQEINNRIANLQNQPGQEGSFVVEVKIDREGEAVPVSLWVGPQRYQF
ncbi:MAG: GDYXXLXY domain-containing protein [Jaaginema sp. PMC 1079.18]|nr:GDYXXLXY domain-containing protein [Jaaginema sp. PMC 1080.18]MEC4852087.1 GDYXXLXY domain-containing protein [Jaaginema sp. PMC 1079.18]MEC4865512.1 GDYXXLXY domain-containing protein [Jaaginema sp. PMC 1078.18]